MRGGQQQHQRIGAARQRHERRIEQSDGKQAKRSERDQVFGNFREAFSNGGNNRLQSIALSESTGSSPPRLLPFAFFGCGYYHSYLFVRRRRSLIPAQGCFNPGLTNTEPFNSERVRFANQTLSVFRTLDVFRPRVETTLGWN